MEEPTHQEEQVSTTDPDSTYATKGGTPARLGYYDNYLVDNDSCVIVGVQATAARMSQETVAAQDMLSRFATWQGRDPESVAADTTYGNGEFLQWLADRNITPYMRTRDSIHRKNSPFYGWRKEFCVIEISQRQSARRVWPYTGGGTVVVDGPEGAMALDLNVSRTGDIAVVRCRGRIVFGEEADELRRVVLSLLKETPRIVLNLVWIEYIDSTGLGTLVASFISARHRGAEIKFAALSPRAQRLLTSTKLDRLFEIYDSTEEAVKSFHPHPEAAAG